MYNDYNIPDGVGDEKKKLTVVVLISNARWGGVSILGTCWEGFDVT